MEMAQLSARSVGIARAIVDAINDDGYLMEPLEEIANTLRPEIQADVAEIELVLLRVQQLDPAGIAARSVSECLELQLRQLDVDTPGLPTAIAIVRSHLELLAVREMAVLRRELKATDEELTCALILVRPATRGPARRSAAEPLNMSFRMYLYDARSTAAGSSRSMGLPCQGCA